MRSLFFGLLALLLYPACSEDSFSQVVEIPLPEHEPLPALTLTLYAGDTAAYTRLALSEGLLADPAPDDNRTGTAELYRNGELIGTQTSALVSRDRFGNDIPPMRLTEPIDQEPATYRLVGKVTGFPEVDAVQEMPPIPDFENVVYEKEGGLDADGNRVDELRFDLLDPPGEDNYYGFRVVTRPQVCFFVDSTAMVECQVDTTRTDFQPLDIDSPSPLFTGGLGRDLLITDGTFNGEKYTIRLLVYNFQDRPLLLEVFHLTEDAYRYGVSYPTYLDVRDNPFAEPVQVHNNVTGGYGVFAVANVVRKEIQ